LGLGLGGGVGGVVDVDQQRFAGLDRGGGGGDAHGGEGASGLGGDVGRGDAFAAGALLGCGVGAVVLEAFDPQLGELVLVVVAGGALDVCFSCAVGAGVQGGDQLDAVRGGGDVAGVGVGADVAVAGAVALGRRGVGG